VSAQATPLNDDPPPPAPVEKRVLGVIPNYRTADANQRFQSLSSRQKMTIAFKDSTDFPVYPTAASFAAIYQWTNSNPDFGQGMKGYAHRFITSYGDQAIGNFMTEGIMPSLFREDPRYFRHGEGHGTKKERLLYAASRVFVTRTDRNTREFNFSEVVGNAVTAAAGNAYYPHSRKLEDNFRRFYVNIGSDALGFVLKEFSPDIKRALFHKDKK
jgi:hypothetical protein